MSITVTPLSPALGAEIGNADIAAGISEGDFQDILEAWHQYSLAVLPGQSISEEQQMEFGARFGMLGPWSRFADDHNGESKNPYIMLVTNLKENGEYIGSLQEGEIQFHSDGIYTEKPVAATMLYAIQPTTHGGETAYGNMTLAYQTLPDDIKTRIDGLKANHAFTYNSLLTSDNEAKIAKHNNVAAFEHPIVRTHPVTQRKALYVNRLMTQFIVGIDEDESRELLAFLYDHLECPKFIYEHKWCKGDILVWDNRCVVHARRNFPPNETRIMKRLTIKGDRPF
jgi:taurine dioxygenase